MSEALKQNSEGLDKDIQTIGCFFRAAIRMAEFVAEKSNISKPFLNKDELNCLWDYAKIREYISEDNNVLNSAGIANSALSLLRLKGRFVEVATFRNGEINWYKSLSKEERRADYYIQKIEQNGPNKTHFINVDKYGVLLWDPHAPEILKQKTLYTICYRYDKGETV